MFYLVRKSWRVSSREYTQQVAFMSLKTLIAVGVDAATACISGDHAFKVTNLLRDTLHAVIPILENKTAENRLFVESTSELLVTWLGTVKGELATQMRRSIMDVFMGNDFFRCTLQTLKYWKDLVAWCSEGEDLLGSLLSKEGLFLGLFTGKAESMRQRIKSFERVCFIIFAGAVDEYQKRMAFLLESINEVIKEFEQTNPALLMLIFFCLRILVLRLSAHSLHELFRNIWPSLLVLLVQVFDRSAERKRSPALVYAALKLVELLACVDIEEFHLHEWIFIYDYYGLKLEPAVTVTRPNESRVISPFQHKPYIYRHLPQRSVFKVDYLEGQVSPPSTVYRKPKQMVIKEPTVDTEQELQTKALWLGQQLALLNEQRMRPDF